MAWKPFNFFKYNPETDENQTFNITKALNGNWDHTKELTEEVRTRVEDAEKKATGLQVKPVIAAATLSANKWTASSKTYSFESEYPNAQYDIIVEIDGGAASQDQVDAWNSADIKGNYPENVLYAKGDVPTIDIPIIRQVIKK